jgi:outer membrane protein assembly factor BamB
LRAAANETVLVGTVDGRVTRWDPDDGITWQARVAGPIRSSQSADLDGDGRAEYVIGTDDAELALLRDDGQILWQRAFAPAHGRPQKVAAIAVADLDGSGQPTILAATEGWRLYAFTPDGRERWSRWIKYHAATLLAAADLDGDGRAEIVVGTEYHTPLNVFGPDGELRWFTWEQVGSEMRATTPRCGTHAKALLLRDLDGDGSPEIVYGTADNRVYAVDPADGRVRWSANVGGEVVGLVETRVAGTPLAVATALGDLFGLDDGGRKLWRRSVGADVTALTGVTRGTGARALAVGTTDGDVLVFDVDGRLLAHSKESAGISHLAAPLDVAGSLWIASASRVSQLKLIRP